MDILSDDFMFFFFAMRITHFSFHFTILRMRLSCIIKRYLIFDLFIVFFYFFNVTLFTYLFNSNVVVFRKETESGAATQ